MPIELKLPNLGENIHSGDVVKLLVSEGDLIEEQQPILEIETDKAAIEVPASQAGRVVKIMVKEGGTISVGDPILTLDATGSEKGEVKTAEPSSAESPKAAPPAKAAEETPAEPRTARSTEMEGQVSATSSGPGQEAPRVARPLPLETSAEGPIPAAPSVRRFAREIGVDIAEVKGSGPRGRISVDDVKAHARGVRALSPPVAALGGVPPAPDFSKWGPVRREALSNVRRATARHVASAWSMVPHVTHFDRADVTELEETRKRYAPKSEQAGGKLTITAIVLKVAASALKIFPKFNASIDVARNELVFRQYIHVGVAVDTDRGLLVPVIRDVDTKNVIQLSVELAGLSEKARRGKLTLEEMQGGSFTVSNLGGIGGTGFSPIVNIPEVAILGIARSSIEPVYRNGQFEPRNILPLSLSYDHRVIDGADGARFLRWVAEALEQPFLLSLEG